MKKIEEVLFDEIIERSCYFDRNMFVQSSLVLPDVIELTLKRAL